MAILHASRRDVLAGLAGLSLDKLHLTQRAMDDFAEASPLH